MSSLSAPPVMNQHAAMQYNMRRASAPTDNVMFYDQPPPRQLSLGEYETWIVNSVIQEPFDSSIDLTMPTESPVAKGEHSQSWWDGNSKIGILDASQEISQRLSVLQSQSGDGVSSSALRRYNNASARHSPYGSLVYLHQPPSPTFDDEDSGIYSHSMASPTPSPPESPDFFFPSTVPTPEVGFSGNPSLGRSSPPPVTVIAAAAAALAASKPPKPRPRQGSSSRPGSSRRKTSTGSMRSQTRVCGSPASGLQGAEVEMAFVNYTPQDATRILNGVAPSGSSKTKARREREAAEKRRRIAAVATAAVEAAGGDPSVLANVV